MINKYPIYVISKGRWESRQTVRSLESMGAPYYIVIEKQEYENYAQYIDEKNILVLPFSNHGTSTPARNWVWQHSIDNDYKRHWILDDNISDFYRFHRNKRIRVKTPTIFRIVEDFVDRYTNIALSGMNYRFFSPSTQSKPPFYKNTRVYSCILIDNSIPFKWSGTYNEDTRLCLDAMKAGYATVLFNAFLAGKAASMTTKGGNTEEVYGDTNKRYEFVRELQESHPDVVELVWRYGRWHHEVDYSRFKNNPLISRDDVDFPKGIDNHGLRLIKWKEDTVS